MRWSGSHPYGKTAFTFEWSFDLKVTLLNRQTGVNIVKTMRSVTPYIVPPCVSAALPR